MNPFETQAKLGRDLFEVNASTIRKFVELGGEEMRKYFELNQEFAQKLPEIRDFSAFVELQREYGQSVWEGVKTGVQSRGDIVREAVETSGGLLRDAFNPEQVEEAQEAA